TPREADRRQYLTPSPARGVRLGLVQERRRLLRRHRVDVEARAPLETGGGPHTRHASSPCNASSYSHCGLRRPHLPKAYQSPIPPPTLAAIVPSIVPQPCPPARSFISARSVRGQAPDVTGVMMGQVKGRPRQEEIHSPHHPSGQSAFGLLAG